MQRKREKMFKILIFGTGVNMQKIINSINYEETVIIAYVDNNKYKTGNKINKTDIISPNQINKYSYDFIIIASIDYINITSQLLDLKVDYHKIVQFYNYSLFFPKLFFFNNLLVANDDLNKIFLDVYFPRIYPNDYN